MAFVHSTLWAAYIKKEVGISVRLAVRQCGDLS